MPINLEAFKKSLDSGEAKYITPEVEAPPPGKRYKESNQPELSPLEYQLDQARTSLADFTGRVLEAGRMHGMGEPLSLSMLRVLAPRALVNAVSPLKNIPAGDSGKSIQDVLTDPVNQVNSPENLKDAVSVKSATGWKIGPDGKQVFEEAKAPGPWSEMFGAGTRAVFDPSSYAFGGPVVKGGAGFLARKTAAALGKEVAPQAVSPALTAAANITANAGAGMWGHEGALAGGALGEALSGEDGGFATAGRMIGGFAGAALGYNIGSIAREGLAVAKDAGEAARMTYKSAEQRKADGVGIFKATIDNFMGLRDTTKDFAAKDVMYRMRKILEENPDITPQQVQAFDDMAKSHGIDPALLFVDQRTNDPTLQQLAKQARERYEGAQGSEKFAAVQRRDEQQEAAVKEAAQKAWEKILPSGAKPFIDTMKGVYDNIALTRQALLEDFSNLFNKRIANLGGPDGEYATGAARAQATKDLYKEAVAKGGEKFQEAERLANEAGTPLVVDSLYNQHKSALETVAANVASGQDVLPTTYKKIVALLGDRVEKGQLDKLLGADAAGKMSLSEMGEVYRAVNRVGAQLKETKPEAFNQLMGLKKSIQDTINTQYSGNLQHISDSWNAANAWWAKNIGEKFRANSLEGINRDVLLGKTDPARVIQDYITPSRGVSQVSSMKAFDRLWGGEAAGGIEGTTRNEQAYKELGDRLENMYRSRVVRNDKLLAKDPDFLPLEHHRFMEENSAAISRVPGLEDKLNGIASKAQRIKGNIDLQGRMLEDMFGGPLARSLMKNGGEASKDEVGVAMSHLLSSPQAMSSFLDRSKIAGNSDELKSLIKEIWARVSPWDQTVDAAQKKKLDMLLTSGKGAGDVPAMQRLFEAAFGKNDANAHMKSLREISTLEERILANNPAYQRIIETNPDPVKSAVGSTPASAINIANSIAQGRSTPVYGLGVLLSRYANQKLQDAWREAQYEAFFSPVQSNLIAEGYKAGIAGKLPQQELVELLAKKMGGTAGEELKAAFEKNKAELLGAGGEKALAASGKALEAAKEKTKNYLSTRIARGGMIGVEEEARNRNDTKGEPK